MKIALLLAYLLIAAIVVAAVLIEKGVKEAERSFETGYEAHEHLWETVLEGAETDKYDKYAIYASRITQLELGEQFYFSLRENRNSAGALYIIYCDNEETYLYDNGELIWMENLTKTEAIKLNGPLFLLESSAFKNQLGASIGIEIKQPVTQLLYSLQILKLSHPSARDRLGTMKGAADCTCHGSYGVRISS